MMRWARKQLRDEWLPLVGRARRLGCFGQTEPDCGSDAGAIKMRAVKDGDYYVINVDLINILRATNYRIGLIVNFINQKAEIHRIVV